jgi:predicted MFS family arabinose efflux permease
MTALLPSRSTNAPLVLLALGTFATGTESFMIAPLLPKLATDLSVSVAVAGQLVTVFALTYAVSSPVLSALTAGIERRKLLIASMAAFAVANVIASVANSYWELLIARILLACAAGLYVPSASALGGAIVAPERRGTALAIVNGGTSGALVLGVPLGAIVGNNFGWRATFVGVAVLAAIATIGLIAGLRRDVAVGLPVASVRERLAVARQSPVLVGLLITTLWATGAYTVYAYLAPYLAFATGIEGWHLSVVLFMWGVAAVVGLFIGGAVSDAVGPRAVMIPALLLLALAFASLSMSATFLSPAEATVPVFIAIIVWGVTAWGFFPAQQSHLIGVARVKVASIVLSLNASFMYFGFSLGAALGSFTLIRSSVVGLGWVGAACEILALVLVLATVRSPTPARLSTASGT